MKRIRFCSLLVLSLISFAAAAAGAPCTAASAACTEMVGVPGASGRTLAAAFLANALGDTVLIAPRFASNEGGTLEVSRATGSTRVTLNAGEVYFRKGGDTHAARNVDDHRYHEVLVELK